MRRGFAVPLLIDGLAAEGQDEGLQSDLTAADGLGGRNGAG